MSDGPNSQPRVSAIVVNFNQADLLRECLASLAIAMQYAGEPHETILVDNGSADGSVEMVRDEFAAVQLIKLAENRGFAGGVAAGLRAAAGEWVLCINNDATVEEGAIAALLRVADDSNDDVGSIAALMVFADRPDIINSAGIEVDRLGVAWDRLLGQPVGMGETSVSEVFGASAGAALYRRAMLDEVPFEESFFAYLEDVDVAWRARMRGWRSLYAPSAVVSHEFSATARHGSPLKYYWSGRNRVRVLARNATTRQLVRNLVGILAFDVTYIAFVLVSDRSVAPIRGRIDGLRSWRRDRADGSLDRRSVELAPFPGFRATARRRRPNPRTS